MDCGCSRGLVHARRAHGCARALALARINPNHHAVQEQRNVGRAHLVDKALGVLGTGEFLLKVRKAKTGVDALAQDAAQMLLALHDGHARSGLMSGQRGRHAGRPAADNDHVEGLRLYGFYNAAINRARFDFRHPSAPPSKVPRPARSRRPPVIPRWGRSPARGQESPPRGSGRSHSGNDPCRHDSGA